MIKIYKPTEERTNQYDIIPEVVNFIVDKIKPKRIFLFGSCARGLITSHSDIDLCIVVEEKMAPKERARLRSILLMDMLDITDFEIDIFIGSEESWKREYKNQGTFIGKIYKEGKLLYGR